MALIINETNLRRLTLNGTNITNVTFNGATIARPPLVTTQPVGGTITDVQTKTLSVVADGLGTSLTYQWYKAGQPISGATSSSYTFDPTSTGTFSFFCRIEGFGRYTDTSSVNVVVETSGSIHQMLVGNSGGLANIVGYTDDSFGGSSNVGSFSPKAVSVLNNAVCSGILAAFVGSDLEGSDIVFDGTIQTGHVSVTVEGFGTVSGNLESGGNFGESFGLIVENESGAVATGGAGFGSYLLSKVGQNLEVKIMYG